MNNRVEIFSDKFKSIKLSFMGVFMTILSLLILLFGFSTDNILYTVFISIIALIGIIFFGLTTFFYIKNIFINEPILILENDGFYDNSSISSLKNSLINWNSVDRIEYMPLMNQGMVSIFLKDEKMYLDRLSLLKKSLTKINIAMGYGEITINMNQIQNIDGIKLAEIMNEYLNIHHN